MTDTFIPPARTATLDFEGGPYQGARVVCTLAPSFRVLLYFEDPDAGGDGTEVQRAADRFKRFGDEFLVSWNIADRHGAPLPANGEGMLGLDPLFARAILDAWGEAMTGVSRPLPESSSSGASSAPAPLTLMEASSESRSRSRTRKAS